MYHNWNMHILTLQDNPLKPVFQKCEEECHRGEKGSQGGKTGGNSTRASEAYIFCVLSRWA